MLCPKCGTENDDRARVCEACVADLVDGRLLQQSSNGKVPLSFVKKALLAVLVIVVAATAFGIIGLVLFSPKYIAKAYFKAEAKGKWGKVFDYLSLDAAEFKDKGSFSAFMDVARTLDVAKFDIAEADHGTLGSWDESVKKYIVKYTLKDNPMARKKTLTLIKGTGKRLLLFDDYMVAPDSVAMVYNSKGTSCSAMRDYGNAIANFDAAIRIKPDYATAFNNRGLSFSNKQDYGRALEDFDEAIKLSPDYAIAYYNRGNTHYENGFYEGAIADYTESLRHSPNFAQAYNSRGRAYLAKRDYNNAISDFTQAIVLHPNYAEAYVNRGTAFNDGKRDYGRAIADYTQAINIYPYNATAFQNRGQVNQNRGDMRNANADFARARELGYGR
jgi:tetratricopeptide (TPR) repeat protein